MQGIENSVLAFLAAVGIAALVWLVAGNAAAGQAGEVPAILVLPACGNGEASGGLGARHARGPPAAGPVGRDIHCGLRPDSTEGMRRAELLTRRFPKVTVLEREELEQIIE